MQETNITEYLFTLEVPFYDLFIILLYNQGNYVSRCAHLVAESTIWHV